MPTVAPLWLTLARAALIAALGLTALSLGGIALAQLPNDDARCIVLYDGFTVAPVTYLFDTQRGQLALDRREVQRLFSTVSPDGKTRAGFVQRFGEQATMTLLVEDVATGAARIVQGGIDDSSSSDGEDQIAWAGDSSAFSFMWRDTARRRFLSISGADGVIRRTIPYTRSVDSHPTLDPVIIAGWTGDNAYVIVAEYANNRFFYRAFAAPDLTPQPTPLDGVPVVTAALSPSGDQVAALTVDDTNAVTLRLISIGGAHDPILIPMELTPLAWQIAWSPSGEYLTVAHRLTRWYYDLYRHDGMPITQVVSRAPSPAYVGTLPALWVGDRWLWTESDEGVETDAAPIRLSAFDAATGERSTLVSNLVPDFADDLFYVPTGAAWLSRFTNQALFPMTRDPRLIVPTYAADGSITVDLFDAATGERQSLLTGAARLIRTHYGLGSNFWSAEGAAAWFVWVAGTSGSDEQTFISVATIETGAQVTSNGTNRAVWRPDWIDGAHIGFIDPQPDGVFLELLNVETGDQRRLTAITANSSQWRAALSPDGGMAAVTAGNSDFTGKPFTLVDLRADTRQNISQTAAGTFLWSPDGERIAFAEYASSRANLVISSRDGTRVERYAPVPLASTPLVQYVAWTGC